jgi:hypothetical protein
MDACRAITADLWSRPIFQVFTTPVNPVADNLPDYPKKVRHPMDLGTVRDKLSKGKYQTTAEWFSDARLVFQNAMDYHQEGSLWWIVARYGMDEFTRLANGLNVSTDQEWLDGVNKQSMKISRLLGQLPSSQKTNPVLSELRQRAEAAPPLTSDRVVTTVERLNAIVEDEAALEDICAILRDVAGISCDGGAEQIIDADKLNPVTLNLLNLYLSARDT